MNRRQKYPNTSTFRFHNANPKNRITGDCVERAICTATGIAWEDVTMALAEISVKTGYSIGTKETYGKFLESLGYERMKQPKKQDGTKFTGKQFCKWLNRNVQGDYGTGIVAHIGCGHIVAIMPTDNLDFVENWKVFDIWDSTDDCIGNYWIKK